MSLEKSTTQHWIIFTEVSPIILLFKMLLVGAPELAAAIKNERTSKMRVLHRLLFDSPGN